MTIYLDVILLENLCMNYIILYATTVIVKKNAKQLRIIAASLLGAIYAIVQMQNLLQLYSELFFKILVSIVMVYIALGSKSIKTLLKDTIIFYLTSFTFGGVAFALLYFIKPEDILMKNGMYVGSYPIKIALMGGLLGFIIITTAFKMIKQKLHKGDLYCNIQIYFKNKSVETKALLDTGNFLKEPITGIPVVVVEKTVLQEIIPLYFLDHAQQIMEGNREIQEDIQEYTSKLRVIPFSSLGKENGILLGFKVDSIIIKTGEEEKEVINVIVGIYEKSLTKDGRYSALISLDILEGEEKNKKPSTIIKT